MEVSDVNPINVKMAELAKELKIDTSDESWESTLDKELRNTKRTYMFYRIVGIIILTGSILVALIALIVDEGSFLGIEIKPHFYGAFMTITMTSIIFINVGKLELKKDRIRTFILLSGLKNE